MISCKTFKPVMHFDPKINTFTDAKNCGYENFIMRHKLPPEQPVVINSWSNMLSEIEAQGYSLSKVEEITGINQRKLRRLFSQDIELISYRIFTRILRLYCYVKYGESIH